MSEQWYCPNCGPEISVTVERIHTFSGPDDYIVCTGCGETVDEKAETPAFVIALQQQIAERDAELSLYRNGYKGACYACESVGELNVSLNIINKGLDEANIIFADRIATLEADLAALREVEREKVAAWILSFGFATGHGDTIEDLLSEAGTQIQELRAAQEWVPVSERLPEQIGACLVCRIDSHGFREIAWAFFNSSQRFADTNSLHAAVTHWMPLPWQPEAEGHTT